MTHIHLYDIGSRDAPPERRETLREHQQTRTVARGTPSSGLRVTRLSAFPRLARERQDLLQVYMCHNNRHNYIPYTPYTPYTAYTY
jgi:hypothetical protein